MKIKHRVILTGKANKVATQCLLQHYKDKRHQEDVCFAIWRPSQGLRTYTALIDEIIPPENGDRELSGNVHLQSKFFRRAQVRAIQRGGGLALMHSHPTPKWQDMSNDDIYTERDYLAPWVKSTHLPLLGMTIGTDGAWSARFWKENGKRVERYDCERVNVVGEKFGVTFHPYISTPFKEQPYFKRTLHTWGYPAQEKLAKIKFGVIGLGSVGCLVAETLTRMGVQNITLIDDDHIECHNLDRLIYATKKDVKKRKVDFFAKRLRRSTVAKNFSVHPVPFKINHKPGFLAALDCDILFCCVDKPVGRHYANHIAYGHLIPVFEGGILTGNKGGSNMNPHWKIHVAQPEVACLRCRGQYTIDELSDEEAGIYGDRAYDGNKEENERANANVFPFSANLASMQVLQMLRQVVAPEYWQFIPYANFQYVLNEIKTERRRENKDGGAVEIHECEPDCDFLGLDAIASGKMPSGLIETSLYRKLKNRIRYLLHLTFRK